MEWTNELVLPGGDVAAPDRAHGPGAVAKMLPPVMGSLIEFENARGEVAFRIYITGDTLFFDELKEIPRRFPDIDLALLHLWGHDVFRPANGHHGPQARRRGNPAR
jgi:hypothetical protein